MAHGDLSNKDPSNPQPQRPAVQYSQCADGDTGPESDERDQGKCADSKPRALSPTFPVTFWKPSRPAQPSSVGHFLGLFLPSVDISEGLVTWFTGTGVRRWKGSKRGGGLPRKCSW